MRNAAPTPTTTRVNWVLGGFGPDQRKQLPEFLADGADAAETIIFNGLAKAQEQFNGR